MGVKICCAQKAAWTSTHSRPSRIVQWFHNPVHRSWIYNLNAGGISLGYLFSGYGGNSSIDDLDIASPSMLLRGGTGTIMQGGVPLLTYSASISSICSSVILSQVRSSIGSSSSLNSVLKIHQALSCPLVLNMPSTSPFRIKTSDNRFPRCPTVTCTFNPFSRK